jgi:hypothetical protein
MAQVTIKIYQTDGAAGSAERKLIRTVRLETSSDRRLNGKRAGQILTNNVPEFQAAAQTIIKTNEGWMAARSLRPSERCSFHYIWEKAIVSEDSED